MANDPWVVFDYEVDMLSNMCNLLQQGNSQYAALSLQRAKKSEKRLRRRASAKPQAL
jgi:hypothetical protein